MNFLSIQFLRQILLGILILLISSNMFGLNLIISHDNQSPAHPREIMVQILGALQGLNVRWKKIGHYNMKCLFLHSIQDPDSMTTNDLINENHYVNGITPTNASVSQLQSVVKFEMQVLRLFYLI